MATVSVTGHFCAAHSLSRYDGDCKQIHGHNFGVRIWAQGPVDSSTGMVEDFKVLGHALREVTDKYDHALILNRESALYNWMVTAPEDILYDLKIIAFPTEPTCEELAVRILNQLRSLLPNELTVTRVEVTETDKYSAIANA